ncbi:hypothetical protein EVAR_37632_1 [Eumeta japonica]|uniref:Uncharacterized protein n=1 Tax=Eumeta variegata TaxID=151549 RepID=A0A4C1VNJ4_EUMVA|nr:hypothetical protein EVAR_37632_1 [Eumeta japonica]
MDGREVNVFSDSGKDPMWEFLEMFEFRNIWRVTKEGTVTTLVVRGDAPVAATGRCNFTKLRNLSSRWRRVNHKAFYNETGLAYVDEYLTAITG